MIWVKMIDEMEENKAFVFDLFAFFFYALICAIAGLFDMGINWTPMM